MSYFVWNKIDRSVVIQYFITKKNVASRHALREHLEVTWLYKAALVTQTQEFFLSDKESELIESLHSIDICTFDP